MLSLITAVFGAIPVIGTVVTSFLNMRTQMAQINATENVEEAKVSAQIIHDTADDVGIRVCRDIICFPVAIWCALATYDTIVAHHYPEYMFVVEKFPDSISYLPMMVLVFLLGNIGLNIWKRR